VIGWETVTVPAGVFRALNIERNGALQARITSPATASSAAATTASGDATAAVARRAHNDLVHLTTHGAMYHVPAIKYFVKDVDEQYDGDNVNIRRDTDVLVSFKPGP